MPNPTANTNTLNLFPNNSAGGLTSTQPFTWAVNDSIKGSISYAI